MGDDETDEMAKGISAVIWRVIKWAVLSFLVFIFLVLSIAVYFDWQDGLIEMSRKGRETGSGDCYMIASSDFQKD